jgi:hypothetical protein
VSRSGVDAARVGGARGKRGLLGVVAARCVILPSDCLAVASETGIAVCDANGVESTRTLALSALLGFALPLAAKCWIACSTSSLSA